MKASDFLKSRGRPSAPHPVTLILVDDSGEGPQGLREAQAVMRFVVDRKHAEALDKAAESLRGSKVPATEESTRAREQAHLLHEILRDKESPAEPFFDSPEEAFSMLVSDERLRLLFEYQQFKESVLPALDKPEDLAAFQEDAKSLFFGDLLKKHGYWRTLRALPSLARILGTLPPNS